MAAEVPAKQFTVFSAAGTYILISHLPYLLLSSKLSYFGTFALLWTSQFVFWAIWRVILWPKCFSPLRKIPGPRSRSWWNGQFSTLHAKHYELPMAEWFVCLLVFNIEVKELKLVTGQIPFQMMASFGISARSTRSAFSLPHQKPSMKS